MYCLNDYDNLFYQFIEIYGDRLIYKDTLTLRLINKTTYNQYNNFKVPILIKIPIIYKLVNYTKKNYIEHSKVDQIHYLSIPLLINLILYRPAYKISTIYRYIVFIYTSNDIYKIIKEFLNEYDYDIRAIIANKQLIIDIIYLYVLDFDNKTSNSILP